MAKQDSKVAMIIVLTVIAIASATVLSLVHSVTQPQIEAVSEERREEAILGVLPGAVDYSEIEKDGLTLYEGLDEDGNVVGTAIERDGSGYGGPVGLMIGLDLDNNKVLSVRILEHEETPGLGARIEEGWFIEQFKEKPFGDEFLIDEDLEGIAGATLSAQAVGAAVSDSIDRIEIALAGGMEEYIAGLIQEVLPGTEEHETVTKDGIELHKGYDAAGDLAGYVIPVQGDGYGGVMELKVGIDPNLEEILGVTVVDHSETAGIGDVIAEADFQEQFIGKSLTDQFVLDEDIDGAAGATVSSEAFVEAVRDAVEKAKGLN
ncbi:FMN-binding protein [Fuchsiella alkaliacetigena]|uniref:FMN-binding protein n=1 Tax=Fuchsiella alkaliacetigena TaxID=957042 RepID=UPI00200AE122|nr:FMN-binding protein [Fuchsiella alkaliacetigena]MCK8824433.1 FMN-binding protein [Fuchsiella alkaliacetigena]